MSRPLWMLLALLLLMPSRAAFFAAQNAGKQWLDGPKSWAVIGDVLNPSKPAARVVAALQGSGKTVHLVNPRDKSGTCFAGLSDVGQAIDVVDLCVNHVEGLKQMRQAAALGISRVFIQPGAESADIRAFCEESQIEVFQGCVMVELGTDGH